MVSCVLRKKRRRDLGDPLAGFVACSTHISVLKKVKTTAYVIIMGFRSVKRIHIYKQQGFILHKQPLRLNSEEERKNGISIIIKV